MVGLKATSSKRAYAIPRSTTHRAPAPAAQTYFVLTGPTDPTETELDLPFSVLSVFCGGTGQKWPATGAGALGAADLGMA